MTNEDKAIAAFFGVSLSFLAISLAAMLINMPIGSYMQVKQSERESIRSCRSKAMNYGRRVSELDEVCGKIHN